MKKLYWVGRGDESTRLAFKMGLVLGAGKMAKGLFIFFSFLIFMANPSFASACVKSCILTSSHSKKQVTKKETSEQSCHNSRKSKQPIKTVSVPDCCVTICVQAISNPEVNVSQIQQQDNFKKVLSLDNPIVFKDLLVFQPIFTENSSPPLNPKIRLHLRLQRLLI